MRLKMEEEVGIGEGRWKMEVGGIKVWRRK